MISLMTCGDTSWLSAPSSSGDGKSDDTRRHIMDICTLVIRRRQVRWHAETNVVICSLCWRSQCLLTETTLVSPSSSGDGKSNDTRKHLLVIYTLFIWKRQVRWHMETPHGYPHPRHPETASLMTHRDQYGHQLPLSENSVSFDRDYFSLTFVIQRWQVRWHVETNHGHLPPS